MHVYESLEGIWILKNIKMNRYNLYRIVQLVTLDDY